MIKINHLYAKALTAVRNISRSLEALKPELNKISDQKQKAEIEIYLDNLCKNFEVTTEIFRTEGTLMGLSIPYKTFLRGPINIRLIALQQSVSSFPGEPTTSELSQANEISEVVLKSIDKLNNFIQKDLDEFNKLLENNGISKIQKPALVTLENR